jgi:hypothetical protein
LLFLRIRQWLLGGGCILRSDVLFLKLFRLAFFLALVGEFFARVLFRTERRRRIVSAASVPAIAAGATDFRVTPLDVFLVVTLGRRADPADRTESAQIGARSARGRRVGTNQRRIRRGEVVISAVEIRVLAGRIEQLLRRNAAGQKHEQHEQ